MLRSFIHDFDAKMHYLIYYSLLKIKDNDEVYINDAVQDKKCNPRLGRWNFIVVDQDCSCGVYHALETIGQDIFSAMESNKNSVDVTLVSTKNDPDFYYVLNQEKKVESHNENCECDKRISKQVFFKVVKPVLEKMFEKVNYRIIINDPS